MYGLPACEMGFLASCTLSSLQQWQSKLGSVPGVQKEYLASFARGKLNMQVHVVGHDWGASLAWYMAMKAPERVKKLVVLSTGHAGECPF